MASSGTGSNIAADHITTVRLALAQFPKKYRRGRRTLIRIVPREAPTSS